MTEFDAVKGQFKEEDLRIFKAVQQQMVRNILRYWIMAVQQSQTLVRFGKY